MKKPSAFLLLLAMALLSVVTLLPLHASSAPAVIDDFGYQTLSTLNLKNDDDTALRFVFTIGNLDYAEVGVIVSKSVANPTYDGAGCYTYKTSTVYRSINAEGTPESAPDGRWWVAVKLTGIPHEYFDGSLYLRAFVKNADQDPVYSEIESLTVCSALGHVHSQAWDAVGSATMQTEGNLACTCPGCDLPVSFTGVKREPIVYNSSEPEGPFEDGTAYRFAKELSEIRGGGHFYPTQEHPAGQDLYFEYSFLWNETLGNWDRSSALAEMKVISIRNTAGKHREFFYLYTRDNNDPFKTSNDCPYKGHFDFSTSSPGNKSCVLYGPDAGYASPLIRSASPYIYDESWLDTNGWHRIGVRFHEEAANDGGSVVYSGFSELYLDGVLVWRIISDVGLLETNDLLLYTAEIENDELVYHDNDDAVIEMRLEKVAASTYPVYIAVGDVFWSCGDGFALDVEREPFPETETLDLTESVTVDAPFYYRPKTEKPADSFTIATWNIGHFSNGKNKNTAISDGSYAAASVKYKTYINDVLGADIICLNEYSAKFTPSNNASNLFDAYSEVTFEGEQRRYSCNALYSKLPLANVTLHEFACNVGVDIQYTDAVEATDYYYITGELELGGETVTVVAVHLSFDDKLYDVSPYIDTVCQNQMRELIETFASTERVLILGDWNAYDYSYFDLFTEAGYTLGNRNEIPTCTGSATKDLEWAVDNMVAKGLEIRDFRGEPTTLSDHVAVIATITLAN